MNIIYAKFGAYKTNDMEVTWKIEFLKLVGNAENCCESENLYDLFQYLRHMSAMNVYVDLLSNIYTDIHFFFQYAQRTL